MMGVEDQEASVWSTSSTSHGTPQVPPLACAQELAWTRARDPGYMGQWGGQAGMLLGQDGLARGAAGQNGWPGGLAAQKAQQAMQGDWWVEQANSGGAAGGRAPLVQYVVRSLRVLTMG